MGEPIIANDPAICANCERISCIVLFIINEFNVSKDSIASSTTKEFNFKCIFSIPTNEVKAFKTVDCKVSFLSLRLIVV